MPGSVKKRGQSSWSVVVDLGPDPETAKRRQLRRTVRGTKREAEELLVRLLHERDSGLDQPRTKVTVGEYLDRWLHDYVRFNTSPATYVQYESLIRRHIRPVIGSFELSRLRPQQVQNLYTRALEGTGERRPLSASSVTSLHRILREALQYATRWQLISRNPADGAEPPRVSRPSLSVPDGQVVRRLLASAELTPYGAVVHLALMSGLRRGEVLGLRWEDVDLDAGVLYVRQTLQRLPGRSLEFRRPKTTSSNRSVALSPATVSRLRRHRQNQLEHRLRLGAAYEDAGLVFTTPIGSPIDPSNLRRAWLGIQRAAGAQGIRFHDLRHAHATLMLQQGTHPKIVSERLGHSGIRVTMDVYSHVVPGLQAEAAAQLDAFLEAPREAS